MKGTPLGTPVFSVRFAPLTLGLVIVAVAVPVPMGGDPFGMSMGWTIPVSGNPDIVAGSAVPVAANPDVVRTGSYPDDHLRPGRRRRCVHGDAQADVTQNGGGGVDPDRQGGKG